MKRKYTFGPVPSRRLGRSLGVDLLPRKTCTFDCTYCQVGRTTTQTTEIKEYVPVDEVIAELESVLDTKVAADYITLSGSGEPTLHAGLKEIIRRIHGLTTIPVAVITNGSLLWKPEVRDALLGADLVVPSLDAGTAETFARINRPCCELRFDLVTQGLVLFREEYKKPLFLEVLLIPGVNDSEEELAAIKGWIDKIRPDRVDLNTAVRPPADPDVKALSPERIQEIAERLGQGARKIADFQGAADEVNIPHEIESAILDTVRRRPVTRDDLAATTGLRPEIISKYLSRLEDAGAVQSETRDGKEYYRGFER